MTCNRSFALALACLSLAGSPAGAEDFAGYGGHQLYERFCASCHGSKGYGDGPVARSLNVLVPDLTRIARRSTGGRFPDERVRKVVDGRTGILAHGTRVMPVWGYEFAAAAGSDVPVDATATTPAAVPAAASAQAIVDKLVEYVRSIQQ